VNQYELTTILNEKTDEKAAKKISNSIKKIIEEKAGKIESEKTLGRKKLAYPIQKNEFGTFLVFKLSLEPEKIKEVNRALKAEKEIIRFLITKSPKGLQKIKKVESKAVSKARSPAEKPKKMPKAKPEPKPEIAKEIESEDKRMAKLEEELDKILEE